MPKAPQTALSPNAAGLGLYGDIPVSLYTGTPDISIPLYEIKVKDFILPITLSYHAAGVQVDQRSGWTGLNWNLFAGGVITRTVNDSPDEYNNPNYSQGGNNGFYYNYNVLNTTSWNQRSYLRTVAQDIEQNLKDTSPDEFSFSFSGYTGKFYLNHHRNWEVQCDKPVDIEFDNTFLPVPFESAGTRAGNYGYSPCFSGFTIITEDGTKYQFGKNIHAIDFSIGFFSQYIDDWIASAWYLTKITLPSKHEINFTYERKSFINQMYIAVRHDLGSETETGSSGIFNLDPTCSSWSYSSIDRSYEGKLISPVYLKEIASDNELVTFTATVSNELKYSQAIYNEKYYDWNFYGYPGGYPFLPILKSQDYGYPGCLNQLVWYKLSNITVQNTSQTESLKTIDFQYNNSSTERLFLNSVSESGKKPYVFSYFSAGSLPGYLANKSDHWGYYNNTYAGLSYSNYYGYRNPNASVLQYGILNKITYPTGGYTEFEFEPHNYRKQLNIERWNPCTELSSNQLAGGLRIKRIKNSSTSQGPAETVKEYYYVSDFLENQTNASQSSGVLGGQVKYYFTDYTVYAFSNNNIRRRMSVFSSISVLPSCKNTNGSHIGYTEVIEKCPDNSFSRYRFTNFDNGYLDESADTIIQQSRTSYEHYASKAFERGKLLLKEDYNNSGGKVRSMEIVYEKDNISNNYVRAMDALYENVCPATAVSYDEGTSYKIYTYLLRPESETEILYDPASGSSRQSVTTGYVYTGRKLIRSVSRTNSDGTVHRTVNRYPFDFPNGSAFYQLASMHVFSPVVEKTQFINSSVIRIDYTNYGTNTNGAYFPSSFSVKTGDNALETRLIHYNHDIYGNPLFTEKDGQEKTVYIWGYSGQYLIGEIKNLDYSSIPSNMNLNTISLRAEPLASDWADINNLRTLFPYAQVSVFKYKPTVGVIESTDPRGVITSYEYDAFSRLTKLTTTLHAG
ncbi:hypothetical protein FACS1894155_08420 [Bacteroidia bacterium]|nr:hypothetical protein FACS1894155_08420 [Bacteroidia bacterium]